MEPAPRPTRDSGPADRRDPDGKPTDHGVAAIRRGDLTGRDGADDLGELTTLYTAAAWLSGHRDRARLRRFPDVRTTTSSGHEFDAITAALAACRHPHLLTAPPTGAIRRWSGWPHAPAIGPALLSLYCWAAHHDSPGTDAAGRTTADTPAGATVRPQLLNQQAVNSLIHLGWAHDPVITGFTWARYTRYCHLLHTWATHADVGAELIEMWLVNRWRERTAHHSPHPAAPMRRRADGWTAMSTDPRFRPTDYDVH